MKILVVSDLHYSLRQFDWLAANAGRYDLIIIAGDMMELGSHVDSDIQASVVEQYFRKICLATQLVVCSGNHDLVEEGDGTRSTEWLNELAIPGLVVDCGIFENGNLRILSFPWWETESARQEVDDWLERQGEAEDLLEIWVHHAPPLGTRTSWNGSRDLGDKAVAGWIETYQPDLVFSGHVHNAPYYPEGSWIDRIGKTVVINGGRQTGDFPATVVVEVEDGSIVWCGMEGCVEDSFLRTGQEAVNP